MHYDAELDPEIEIDAEEVRILGIRDNNDSELQLKYEMYTLGEYQDGKESKEVSIRVHYNEALTQAFLLIRFINSNDYWLYWVFQ